VALGLGPAVFEEIFFRGILLKRIYTKLGALPAILISLGVFALYHIPGVGSWQEGVGVLFGGGLMLTALWFLTKRLWVTMAAHFAWNFFMTGIFGILTTKAPLEARGLLSGILSGPMWITGGNGSPEGSLPLIIIPFLISAVVFYIAWRRGDLRKSKQQL
jgi:membrane protease YdiL (CAAX protease family)